MKFSFLKFNSEQEKEMSGQDRGSSPFDPPAEVVLEENLPELVLRDEEMDATELIMYLFATTMNLATLIIGLGVSIVGGAILFHRDPLLGIGVLLVAFCLLGSACFGVLTNGRKVTREISRRLRGRGF